MPNRVLCPKCHGQRMTYCRACDGSGKRSFVGIIVGNCKVCNGTGQQRCDLCGGLGQVEPAET